MKSATMKLSTLLIVFVLGLTLSVSPASANVHITNYSGTTKESTTSHSKNYHHFYSSRETINVKFKVDQFVKTAKNKTVYVQVQKSNGFWWSTQTTKSVTNTNQISFNVSAGTGDYRIVVYDAAEPTGYDKPPLYRAKSTKYSGSVSGL
ncbi:hypothetical protein AB685_08460 [Bacillus sp. LL01]|uniref:hypothetical protein n=1 Tax=Bacillus sp. LL01 TaxID=1665556 RepID=UPI00064D6EC1|nr:hypothetical protein [Bacillus sp. LL01]KMJ59086.1 hypothetical protein AB685_08460 [Bacillus sp. LL01]